MGKVHQREVILPTPFTVITDYGDSGETPDGVFNSIDLGDNEHGWSVTLWDGSTTYVNVNGTTTHLDDVTD